MIILCGLLRFRVLSWREKKLVFVSFQFNSKLSNRHIYMMNKIKNKSIDEREIKKGM